MNKSIKVMNKSIKLSDGNIENGINILENTFIDINNSLFKGDQEQVEVTGPLTNSSKDTFIYMAFLKTSENLVNNVNQVNHWSNAALSSLATISLLDLILLPPVEDAEKRVEKYNLTEQINQTLRLLVPTFQDIIIFKSYVMALKEVYKIKYTENLLGFTDRLENRLIKNFAIINKSADKVNALLGDEYIGKFQFDEDNYFIGYEKMLDKVKDLSFLGQAYAHIANGFFADFNLSFKTGKSL